MKRCPECRRDYTDETLNFCLDDGARLVEGPFTGRLPAATEFLPTLASLGSAARSPAASGLHERSPGASVAVLAFLNLSRGEDGEYFSDGLAEELLNVLSKIRGLRVAARTSAFSFKGTRATVTEIGRTLNVESLLEGSVRIAGDRVRVAVQLVKVDDGYQLWSETYDRTMKDVFEIQDDIAQAVVAEIRTRLLGEEPGTSANIRIESDVAEAMKGRAADPESQRLMLLGRYLVDRTTRDDTAQAVKYFRQALVLDPEYALCWAELARAYSIEAGRGWAPVEEGYSRSREAAERALYLEPELAEGHAQLGRIKAAHDWDFAGAEASYQRALELAPGSSAVLDGASVLFYKTGRLTEAVDLSRRVLEQDPLSAAYWHNLGLACHAAGNLKESEKAFLRALELAPQRIVTSALLALVLLDEGKANEALEQAKRETDEFWRDWALAIIFDKMGDRSRADSLLQKLINESAEGNAYQISEVYAMRDDKDNAFEWLERAIKEHDPGVTHVGVNPRFRLLHVDGRWSELITKLGLRMPPVETGFETGSANR
jgi:TolB-like protein/Tfp pilus assembly protein PilF